MPLDTRCTSEARSRNIRQLIREGYPRKQAAAIAYAVQRRACECRTVCLPRRRRRA